jgi:hypothetical protein
LRTFDDLLLQIIDRILRYTFGDVNADIIYDYLEKKGCKMNEIPIKLSVFSEELRNIIGSGEKQLLGVAPILEEAILELLYVELKTNFDRQNPASFEDQIKKLREICNNRQDTISQPIFKGDRQEENLRLAQLPPQKKRGERH